MKRWLPFLYNYRKKASYKFAYSGRLTFWESACIAIFGLHPSNPMFKDDDE